MCTGTEGKGREGEWDASWYSTKKEKKNTCTGLLLSPPVYHTCRHRPESVCVYGCLRLCVCVVLSIAGAECDHMGRSWCWTELGPEPELKWHSKRAVDPTVCLHWCQESVEVYLHVRVCVCVNSGVSESMKLCNCVWTPGLEGVDSMSRIRPRVGICVYAFVICVMKCVLCSLAVVSACKHKQHRKRVCPTTSS